MTLTVLPDIFYKVEDLNNILVENLGHEDVIDVNMLSSLLAFNSRFHFMIKVQWGSELQTSLLFRS